MHSKMYLFISHLFLIDGVFPPFKFFCVFFGVLTVYDLTCAHMYDFFRCNESFFFVMMDEIQNCLMRALPTGMFDRINGRCIYSACYICLILISDFSIFCRDRYCGHYHRNAGGIYHNTRDGTKTLQCVTSAAVGITLTTKQGTLVFVPRIHSRCCWWWWYSSDGISDLVFSV